MIVIFAPELRRGLEQLGTNQFKKFIGISTKSLENKTKETIYMVVIAATEMAKKNKDTYKGPSAFTRILAFILLAAMLLSTFAALISALISK